MCPGCVAVVNSLHVDENLDKGREEEGGKREGERRKGKREVGHTFCTIRINDS